MNRLTRYAVLFAVLAPAMALAQGITNTRHDLSSASTATVKSPSETQQCIFCHTPHRAGQQALIWNHTASAVAHGWSAGQNTADGTPLPTTLTQDSLRCLACHDGTVALGDVANAGGGTAGVIPVTGGGGGGDRVRAGYTVGGGPVGNTMVNNHPVSLPYAGETGYNGITSGALDDGAIGNYFASTNVGCLSPSGFCTAAGANGLLINLKPNATNVLGVECSSCHEPHNKYGPNLYFLRVTQASSALCKACHNK